MLGVGQALQDVDIFHLKSAFAKATVGQVCLAEAPARQPSPGEIIRQLKILGIAGLPSRSLPILKVNRSPSAKKLRRDSFRRELLYVSSKYWELLARRAVACAAGEGWWAWVDLNYRPRPYQGRALAT